MKNGFTVQISVLPFCVCVCTWQSVLARAVCVCVVVVLGFHVCMVGTASGWLSHWFVATDSNLRCGVFALAYRAENKLQAYSIQCCNDMMGIYIFKSVSIA